MDELSVISYNLSWATQSNNIIAPSSEKYFVRECYRHQPKKAKKNKLSWCTKNAANGIANTHYDILLIQEGIDKYTDLFVKKIIKKGFSCIKSKISSSAILYIIYNHEKLGKLQEIYKGNLTKLIGIKGARPFAVLYSKKKKLLIINVHFPHLDCPNFIRLLQKLNKKLHKITVDLQISRIIMGGDFNDAYGCLIGNDMILLGKRLMMNNIDIPQTCCWDHYSYSGDYIFDTMPQKYFGIVNGFSVDNAINFDGYFGSDHLPVIAMN